MTSSVQRKKLYKQRLEQFFLLGRNQIMAIFSRELFSHSLDNVYQDELNGFLVARLTHKSQPW
jgi:hypothetical protein